MGPSKSLSREVLNIPVQRWQTNASRENSYISYNIKMWISFTRVMLIDEMWFSFNPQPLNMLSDICNNKYRAICRPVLDHKAVKNRLPPVVTSMSILHNSLDLNAAEMNRKLLDLKKPILHRTQVRRQNGIQKTNFTAASEPYYNVKLGQFCSIHNIKDFQSCLTGTSQR